MQSVGDVDKAIGVDSPYSKSSARKGNLMNAAK